MRSIRLSLVVYFLLLLAGALGAVCWFVHELAANALDQRYRASKEQVTAQYLAHRAEVDAGFDRRVLQRARYVAAMARTPVHAEAAYPVGLVGLAAVPEGHLHLWLWLKEGFSNLNAKPRGGEAHVPNEPPSPSLADGLFRLRSGMIDVDAAEELLSSEKREAGSEMVQESESSLSAEHAREYFQAFLRPGSSIMRSQTLVLADATLPIEGRLLKQLMERQPHERFQFDTVTSGPGGATLRRVTLVASLKRTARSMELAPWAWIPTTPKMPAPKGFSKQPGGGPGGQNFRPPEIPFFVQYAIDVRYTESRLQHYADERDNQLLQLEKGTRAELQALQEKLWWIALATFLATLAGGYVLLRVGLAPIGRLSEAVSEVSERDFRLNLDPQRLPAELQPIAERLSQTLTQLGRAFDREKQAAADISHELRTPLAALLTTVEVALRKARTGDEYREILEECRLSGRQMSHMVERLLALARLDAGAERARPRPVDAGDLALQCADLIRPLARAAGLTLTTHVAVPLTVEIDPDKLREVVTNLLHNAVEYNRPGGTIELTVDHTGDELCIDVRDTGIGIRPEARAQIFERFYRADPSRHADSPHAGLGLAIVKSYIDLLGGSITVDSEPGVGTHFHIRLPVAEVCAEPTVAVA